MVLLVRPEVHCTVPPAHRGRAMTTGVGGEAHAAALATYLVRDAVRNAARTAHSPSERARAAGLCFGCALFRGLRHGGDPARPGNRQRWLHGAPALLAHWAGDCRAAGDRGHLLPANDPGLSARGRRVPGFAG